MRLTPKQEKFYVYHLVDPRTNSVFYVGKGQGNRILDHESDAKKLKARNTGKEQVIRDVLASGMQIKRVIVKRFYSETDALNFEKSEINRIGISNLTNAVPGQTSRLQKDIYIAESFIKDLSAKIPTLSDNYAAIAIKLIDEMKENLRFCYLEIKGGA